MNELAEKLIGYLNSAEGFLQTQMPDFANQFVAYHTWEAQYWFHLCLTFLIVMIVAQVITVIFIALKDDNGEDAVICFVIVGAIGTLSLFMLGNSYMSLKKLEIAPKVYMVEMAKKMIVDKK